MAVTADYKYADPTIGVYGVKNPFYVIINRTGAAVYNLTYDLRVTYTNTGQVITKSLTPIGTQATANPLVLIEDFMFNEYTGQTESSAPNSFGYVQIEIGETFAAVEGDAPTFQGYDTDDSFLVYNGYKPLMNELNYRDPNWYDTTPLKLPKIKKTLYLLEDDIELLSFPSFLALAGGVLVGATKRITTFYDSSGSVIQTDETILTSRPDLTGTAYWNININPFFIEETAYVKVKIQYDDGESAEYFSEEITIYRAQCNPKQGRYRLRWANNEDGDEYQNFTLATDKIVQVQKGKRILSDGIDYAATTFADLTNINRPNIREVGNKTTNLRRLRTDYLRQEELDALETLYKSEAVIMFDHDNNILPVIVRDTNFTITDVRNELVKIEVLVEIANIER
jgi:hypothetical protein